MPLFLNFEEVDIASRIGAEGDLEGNTMVLELAGVQDIELRLTELDQATPAGRFRLRMDGDQLILERLLTLDANGRDWLTDRDLAIFDAVNGLLKAEGLRAIGVVRIAAALEDTETVTIGVDVYEFDTHDASTITAGRIRLNVSGGSTVKSAGSLTVDSVVTAGDTMTIDGTVFTFVADGDFDTAGEISIGATPTVAQVQANIVAAINGTDGVNAAHGTVSAGAFAADVSVITALAGGTAGDALTTTETFTAGTNIFDAGSLGTTTAGVNPTAGEGSDALIAAVNASGTESIRAIDISANEVLLVATAIGAITTAIAETMAGTNNAVDTAALRVGAAQARGLMASVTRVPNATEVALGNVHVPLDFDPVVVHVQVRVTATGAAVAWDGDTLITAAAGSNPAFITINNDGSVDWATTDTIHVLAIE